MLRANQKIFLSICFFAILSTITIQMTGAQSDSRWTSPEKISSKEGQASPPYMVSDQYGFVHLFWSESGYGDARPIIRYSRFDGDAWSVPNDIYIAGSVESAIGFVSPFVDSKGILHIIWSEGSLGPLMYSRAPAYDAISAKSWLRPIPIRVPVLFGGLVVDSKGVLHAIYSDFFGKVPGVYYIRSEDAGQTWSTPLWLDPDIPEGQGPVNVNFEIDENDGLHALWFYRDVATSVGTWIRYSKSEDEGNSWSLPFTIDKADESFDEIRLPYPSLATSGEMVHVIWAGNSRTNREHRYSLDSGRSWTPTYRILGELHGQALGGGLEFDSKGRLNYVAQMRYPIGIHHTTWENGSWSIPSLAYFIGKEDVETGKIHAHNIRLAIRAGNQLVVAFTSSPTDLQISLYVIQSTLEDAPEIPAIPTPTSPPVILPTPTPTIDYTVGAITPLSPEIASPPTELSQPSQGLIWGIIPTLIILSGLIIYWAIRKR